MTIYPPWLCNGPAYVQPENSKVTPDLATANRRISEFFSDDSGLYQQHLIIGLIQILSKLGPTRIFGGMLRDFALGGASRFLLNKGDVDIVVDAPWQRVKRKLDSICRTDAQVKHPYKINNKNGYKLRIGSWLFDVWTVDTTYAIKKGFVKKNSIESLLKTTFFDWDAWLYDPQLDTLITNEGVIETMNKGVVSINLQPNPDPINVVRRALKLQQEFRLSGPLKQYVKNELSFYVAS